MIIGARLKEARVKKGLSQEELGHLLGVSKVSICGYEKGTRTPTMENFLDLIKILEIDAKYALGIEIRTTLDDGTVCDGELSSKDIEIITSIKNSRELYNKLCNDPKRTVEQIKSKMN